MPPVESAMLELGTEAPDFTLPNAVNGEMCSLQNLKSDKATVVMFICNHCPFVIHLHDALARVTKEYAAKGISFIAINSNDAKTYPADSPENMKVLAAEKGFDFPYLYDETQEIARDYDAVCTPDLFVFDNNLECVYRGQFDDSRPKNDIPPTGKDLTNALDAILAGQPVSEDQKPSIGCSIKWKPENL